MIQGWQECIPLVPPATVQAEIFDHRAESFALAILEKSLLLYLTNSPPRKYLLSGYFLVKLLHLTNFLRKVYSIQ